MHSSRPREIRQLVQQHFADLGSASGEIDNETLLIRDGHYCGHRFQNEHWTAVWFLEEDQIKIYGEDGHLARVVSPSHSAPRPQREAA